MLDSKKALEMVGFHLNRVIGRLGYEPRRPHFGLSESEAAMVERVRDMTLTGPLRIAGLMDAVRYVTKNGLPGSFVECGVWRGGSIVVAALTLMELGDTSRDLYLFDTFEGMSEPDDRDRLPDGRRAADLLNEIKRRDDGSMWALAPLDRVRSNVLATGYPAERIHFIQGKVEDTLPANAPERIALLRLDTDWYESTRHELTHLYPRLCTGGVLIVDDYGHWQGSRLAVDEFFAARGYSPLLGRMDYTGRMFVKPSTELGGP